MSNNLKTFKKGEPIFSEGEKALKLYIVQTGLVSVFLPRTKKNIEIFQVTSGQVLGEHALISSTTHPFSAVALNETKVLELPVELIRQQLTQAPGILQLLLRSIVEKQKTSTNEIKSIRMEKDSSPCPAEHVAKVFGVIFHVAKHVGMEKEDRVSVTWSSFKQYAQRVFLENPVRLENACNILVKLKLAEFQIVKDESDPEAPPEYGYLHFFDLNPIEKFFEYFQHYYYKGGANPDFFRADDKLMNLVTYLLKFSETAKENRAGVVQVNYKEMLEQLKAAFGGAFTPDQFDRLEQKGLFIKRETNNAGGWISFYRHDFDVMVRNWRILREIEKWNDKGVVDLVDPQPEKVVQAMTGSCPACSEALPDKAKFCSNCGHKLVEAKAA